MQSYKWHIEQHLGTQMSHKELGHPWQQRYEQDDIFFIYINYFLLAHLIRVLFLIIIKKYFIKIKINIFKNKIYFFNELVFKKNIKSYLYNLTKKNNIIIYFSTI